MGIMNIYLKKENKMNEELLSEKEILSEEELMHEYQEWEEDYAERQAEFYEQNL